MLFNIKNFVGWANHVLVNFKLQTQMISTLTLLVSFFVSSIASWSILTVQGQINLNNNRFTNELYSLFIVNVISLAEQNKSQEILSLCGNFYESIPNIRYILFIDGFKNYYSIPYNYDELFSLIQTPQNKQHSNEMKLISIPHKNFKGVMIIGTNPNSNFLNSTLINYTFIITSFTLFWGVVILGIVFNKIILINPLNEISLGLRCITSGDFSKRIKSQPKRELRELTFCFNEMGRSLELFEEQTQERLLSEKTKLERLIATITDGIILLDTNLTITLVNSAAIKIFGWKTKTRLVGTSIWNHLPVNLQKKVFTTLQGILLGSNSVIFFEEAFSEITQISKKFVRVTINIIYDSNGENKVPVGIGIVLHDTTKELELDKTQDRFISNISHELRTPLFNIKSFIETIQEYDYTLSNWQKRYFLNIVNKETDRLTRLVNDILSISKLNSTKNVPFRSMDLREIFYQTLANYQIAARDKDISLYSEFSFKKSTINGNKNLLFQVLVNLVGNALKFTYKKGEVLIRAYQIGNGKIEKIRIEVVDTGIGIIYSDQQDIFQRFYRIENDVHSLKGTGLGLSIVKTILSEHRTTIHVISRYNIGSIFWFDLELR